MGGQFCVLYSGSSGNAVYLSDGKTRILIDSGVSGVKIERGLKKIGVKASDIDYILISHEHKDHIHSVGTLSRRYDIPVYANESTWLMMDKEIGVISEKNRCVFYSDKFFHLGGIDIKPFRVPHDAVEPVGFSCFIDRYKISIVTDIGHISQNVFQNILDSNILLLEANHDENMLKIGPYPWFLKQRILGNKGHLSNTSAGELLSAVYDDNLRYVFLGHISEKNNFPELAFRTVEQILNNNNIYLNDYLSLSIASRRDISRVVTFKV